MYRKGRAAVILDSLKNGDAIMTEISSELDTMRISRINNPFRIKTLFENCYEYCDLYQSSMFKKYYESIGRNKASGGGCTVITDI